MAKRYPLNISKSSGLVRKPYLTLENIKKEMIANGYDGNDIDLMAQKYYQSQFVYGNFDNKKLIDLNKDIKMIISTFNKERTPKYKETPQLEGKLQVFIPLVEDMNDHLRNKQTPMQLLKNANDIAINIANNPVRIHSSANRLLKNYDVFQKTDNYLYFDTEILGGVNKYGFNELLAFQEFALSEVKKVNNGKPIIEKSSSILFGLDASNIKDKKVIERLNNYIKNYEKTGQLDNESTAAVSLRRLEKLGDKNTEILYKDGIASIKSWASDKDKFEELNIESVKKGLARTLEIGEYNKNNKTNIKMLGNEQMSKADLEFLSMIDKLNKNFVLGKNNVYADTPWINKKADDIINGLSYNQKLYLGKIFNGDYGTLYYPNGMIDQESVDRLSKELTGLKGYYTNKELALLKKLNLTPGQLQGIGEVFFPEVYKKGAAHSGLIDTEVGINYASMPLDRFEGMSLMEKQFKDISELYNGINETIVNGKVTKNGKSLTPLFLAKGSDAYNSGPFDFTYDQMTNEIHFGLKKTLNEKGEVQNALFKPGLNKNVSYKINLYNFNPTEEMLKTMGDIDFKNNLSEAFYMLEYTPVYGDREVTNKELEKPIYRLLHSIDEVEAHISNNTIMYGFEDENGNRRILSAEDGYTEKQINELKKQIGIISIGENGITYNEPTIENILDMGYEYTQNESAARSIRNYDLKKADSVLKVNSYLEDKGITDKADKRDIIAMITSSNIAEEIAKGNDLTLDMQEVKADIISLVGYTDKNGNTALSPNTFKNFISTYGYYDSYGDILKNIVNLSKNAENPQLAYQTYMQNLQSDLDSIIGNGLQEDYERYARTRGIPKEKRFGFDTNYYEIKLNEGFFHNYESENPDIFRINLNSRKYYSLTNNLLNAEYGKEYVNKMSETEKDEYGRKQLTKLINHMNSNEDTEGIFNKTISEFQKTNKKDKEKILKLSSDNVKISNSDLAEKIIDVLRKERSKSPEKGYITADNFENVIHADTKLGFIKKVFGDEVINKSINNTSESLKNITTDTITRVNKESINRKAEEIVNEILFRQVDPENKYKNLRELSQFASKTYGYNQNIFYAMTLKTKEDEMLLARNLAKAVMSNGGHFTLNDNNLFVTFGKNDLENITDLLPKARFQNGNFSISLGESVLMPGMRLNVEDAVDYMTGELDTDKIKISSGLITGIRRTSAISASVQRAIEKGENPSDMIKYTLKKMGKELRESPQSTSGTNPADMINAVTNINLKEIIPLIGAKKDELLKAGILDDNGIKALKNNNAENLKREYANSDLLQILPANFKKIMQFALGLEEFDTNNIDQFLLNQVNTSNKDTALAKYIFRLGEKDRTALGIYDNNKRPVPTQILNSKVYNRKDIENYIKSNSKYDKAFNHITSVNKLISEKEAKIREKTVDGVGQVTSSFNALIANMSDTRYHEILSDYYKNIKDKISPEDEEKYKKAFEVAGNYNLYNGQKIMNSRLAYKLFEDTETQYIKVENNTINTIINARADDAINQNMFKKKLKVLPFVQLNDDGTITFEYSEPQKVSIGDVITQSKGYGDVISQTTSNYNGLLTMKFYSKNTNLEISDKTIQHELDRKRMKNEQDIYSYLMDKYTFQYKIRPYSQKGYNKFYIDNEKGMGISTALGAGHIDKNIKRVLEETGNGELIDTILNEDATRVLLSDDHSKAVLNKYGFKDTQDFINALNKERNFIQDEIFSNINGLNDVAIITNDNLSKHENIGMYLRNMINTSATKRAEELKKEDSSLSYKDAYAKAYKDTYDKLRFPNVLSGYNLDYDNKENRILINSDKRTNGVLKLDEIEKLSKKLGLEDYTSSIIIRDQNGQPLYSKNNSIIYSAGDSEFSGTSRSYENEITDLNEQIDELRNIIQSKNKTNKIHEEKGIEKLDTAKDTEMLNALEEKRRNYLSRHRLMSVDKRVMGAIKDPKYTSPLENQEMKDIWYNLDNGETFKKLFGEIFEEDENGNPALKEKYRNGKDELVNAPMIEELNKKLLYNKDLEYMGGGYSKLTKDYIKGTKANDIKRSIYDRFKNKDISIDKAEINYALEKSEQAMKFNANPNLNFDDSYMKKYGFKKADILDDIFIPKGNDSASMLENEKSMLEKNILLTIGNKEIAVPYIPSSVVGNQVINTDRTSTLKKISNYSRLIQEAQQGKIELDKPISFYQDLISQGIDELKNNLKEEGYSLKKESQKLKLDRYAYSKLGEILYHKEGSGLAYANNSLYTNSKFMGKTLGELAEKDIYIPAMTANKKYFMEHTNYFKPETLNKFDMTEEEMSNYLTTEGTIGMLTRSPITERYSPSFAMLFMNRDNNIDMINQTAELAEVQNADTDGDTGALVIAMLDGQSYAEAKLISSKNGTPLAEKWHSMERAIANTANQNLRVRKNLVEPRMEKEENNMLITIKDMFGKSDLDKSQKKYIYSLFANGVTPQEINQNLELNKMLTDYTRSVIGEDKFKSLNENEMRETLINATEVFNEKDRKALKNSIDFIMSLTKEKVTSLSKTTKGDVGYMDTVAAEMQDLGNILNTNNDSIPNHIYQAISKTIRESPISRKHDNALETTATADLRKAWKGATRNYSYESINDFIKLLEPFKEGIIEEAKYKTTLPKTLYNNDEELYSLMTNRLKNDLTNLQKNKSVQFVFNEIKKPNYSNANSKKIMSTALPFGSVLADLMDKEKISPEELASKKLDLSGFKKETAKKVLKEGQGVIENIDHGMSGLGIGALGLAAAVMMAGYVGGNPSKPAQNHAQEQNDSEYDSLQDEDLQINKLPQGSKQGYVININATSDKGRKHVQDAIQVAMQSSVPTDINIQMNIDDKTRNIDNRYITKLLSGAI